ncbi:uncharacterized protein LOC115307909 isoform X2 [Manacus vitellinus]|uniref:uncharacterized protein LOC115307909 isoform X2 n=1 Tax=Manacus vitellinus TaxID=328815 RepID=UPI00115D32BE|nr:uncharacterized protein LOC115307909 isoform X2 [Manacus vitellinus]
MLERMTQSSFYMCTPLNIVTGRGLWMKSARGAPEQRDSEKRRHRQGGGVAGEKSSCPKDAIFGHKLAYRVQKKKNTKWILRWVRTEFTAAARGEMAVTGGGSVGHDVNSPGKVTAAHGTEGDVELGGYGSEQQLLTWPPVSSRLGRSAEEAAGGRAGGHPWGALLGCLPALLGEHVCHTDPSSRSSSECWLYLGLS